METNDAGIALIKQFEGCNLTAYQDPVGILTIGVGHTGDDVTPGLTITDAQATDLLKQDLKTTETGINKLIDRLGLTLNSNQFSALVCLAYNIGVGRVASSSIIANLENDNLDKAADDFLLYQYAKGVPLPGLLRRRKAERALFLA